MKKSNFKKGYDKNSIPTRNMKDIQSENKDQECFNKALTFQLK